jgi:hypothetical protein
VNKLPTPTHCTGFVSDSLIKPLAVHLVSDVGVQLLWTVNSSLPPAGIPCCVEIDVSMVVSSDPGPRPATDVGTILVRLMYPVYVLIAS